MIYWTKKKSKVSIRYRAYKELGWRNDNHKDFTLLNDEPLAEIYIFISKENHGSCMGMIQGKSLTHFMSKEEAFKNISEQLK